MAFCAALRTGYMGWDGLPVMGGFLADAGASDALLLIAPASQRVFWHSSPDWTNRPVDAEIPWYDWVLLFSPAPVCAFRPMLVSCGNRGGACALSCWQIVLSQMRPLDV
jgi:hypothetical protein